MTTLQRLATAVFLRGLFADPYWRDSKQFTFWREAAGVSPERAAAMTATEAKRLYNRLTTSQRKGK